MAHIISVSYDEPLLFTRELMLRERRHIVTSALGFDAIISPSANRRTTLRLVK